MSPAIRIQNLAKRYVVRHEARVGYRTLRESLTECAMAPLRRLRGESRRQNEEFWALKDVSFDVQPGEVVGIIGRNGAGKSTLLKILSRITAPTRGRVEINGRIGSLLEVGTGFHPELTGRENIYLNGSILGMRKAEIDRKFDAIVDFAEIEQFLDTPVKRYSSGMYVRLAFAVAANLQPEILIIDEVLAVGDALFQKKCLGRMSEVARGGRTVFFVSHNMAAIQRLCNRVLYLRTGNVALDGDTRTTIDYYLADGTDSQSDRRWLTDEPGKKEGIILRRVAAIKAHGDSGTSIDYRDSFSMVFEYELLNAIRGLRLGIIVTDGDGVQVFGTSDYGEQTDKLRLPGKYETRCIVPAHLFNSGRFYVTVGADQVFERRQLFYIDNCIQFEIEDFEGHGPGAVRPPGIVRPKILWEHCDPSFDKLTA